MGKQRRSAAMLVACSLRREIEAVFDIEHDKAVDLNIGEPLLRIDLTELLCG